MYKLRGSWAGPRQQAVLAPKMTFPAVFESAEELDCGVGLGSAFIELLHQFAQALDGTLRFGCAKGDELQFACSRGHGQ